MASETDIPGRLCRVLVVDDAPAMREVLQARIERWGFPVRTAETVAQARALVATFDPDLVISDLVLPDATGLALLEHLRSGGRERSILMITAYGTIDVAVAAIKGGAADFVTKPLDYVALRRFIDAIDDRLRGAAQKAPLEHEQEPLLGMVGGGEAMLAMHQQIRAAAGSSAPVLIIGESGSGKELVARSLHRLGPRGERPFVPVNAAAIPEALAEGELFGAERGAFTGAVEARVGLFEQASGGTLFLDEITEMPLALQAKLLRVLEDGKIRRVGARVEIRCDARIIAATNRDPLAAVEGGRMRRDLLYRLDVLRVEVPPLRERLEDLPALIHHFLRDCSERYGKVIASVEPEARDWLLAHDWPGNVRELRNVIERASLRARGSSLTREDFDLEPGEAPATLPNSAREPGRETSAAREPGRETSAARSPGREDNLGGIVLPHGITAAEAERILIMETLRLTGNNKAEAARRLGLDVKTIRNKLKAFLAGAT